jgi:two-component system sensor histidine kinase LytS
VVGTYAGVPMMGAIPNLRAMGVITGGLFGGPWVGAGAGLIAGGHRFLIDMNGFSSIPCGLSTFLEGLVAGIVARKLRFRVLNWHIPLIMGVTGESAHMLITLALARPLSDAIALVKIVSIPMILVNTIGAVLFVQIIRFILRNRERIASIQAQKALTIATLTISNLREGLTPDSARETAKILYLYSSVAGVVITDYTHVLACIDGYAWNWNSTYRSIKSPLIKKVLKSGEPVFTTNESMEIANSFGLNSEFESSIIVPLKKGDMIQGTLILFGDANHRLNDIDFQIALGLSRLFSAQLELEDIQIKEKLLAEAEIRHLQSQINPHFLFNSLNSIVSLCRSDPEKARELLLILSSYLRANIRDNRNFIKLSEELSQINAYLAIEQVRYRDRIRVRIDVEPECLECFLPPLIIQPLVENAIKHGLWHKEEGGEVLLSISRSDGMLNVLVQDNGQGMPPEILEAISEGKVTGKGKAGMGLYNITRRMVQIYGTRYSPRIISAPGKGTKVFLKIPGNPRMGTDVHSETEISTK